MMQDLLKDMAKIKKHLAVPAVCTVDHGPVDGMREWWIARSTTLPRDRMNGWVVSAMLDEYKNEGFIGKACDKPTFAQRMREAGLGNCWRWKEVPARNAAFLRNAARLPSR